jgi:hypothetical protein
VLARVGRKQRSRRRRGEQLVVGWSTANGECKNGCDLVGRERDGLAGRTVFSQLGDVEQARRLEQAGENELDSPGKPLSWSRRRTRRAELPFRQRRAADARRGGRSRRRTARTRAPGWQGARHDAEPETTRFATSRAMASSLAPTQPARLDRR